MKNSQGAFVAPLLLVITAILLASAGAYVYLYSEKKQVSQPVTESSVTQATSTAQTSNQATSTTTTSEVQSQLAIDLSTVTSQFIDDGGNGKYRDGTPLPDYLMNIKKDISTILYSRIIASGESITSNTTAASIMSSMILAAIGKRYVLFTIPNVKLEAGTSDTIFDSVTQKPIGYITAMNLFATDKVLVYANESSICTYAPDGASCIPLLDSQLSLGEEYWDPMGNGPELKTHTDTSFTITVFSDHAYGVKLRDVTFNLP